MNLGIRVIDATDRFNRSVLASLRSYMPQAGVNRVPAGKRQLLFRRTVAGWLFHALRDMVLARQISRGDGLWQFHDPIVPMVSFERRHYKLGT